MTVRVMAMQRFSGQVFFVANPSVSGYHYIFKDMKKRGGLSWLLVYI